MKCKVCGYDDENETIKRIVDVLFCDIVDRYVAGNNRLVDGFFLETAREHRINIVEKELKK